MQPGNDQASYCGVIERDRTQVHGLSSQGTQQSSYALNESIVQWGSSIKIQLMDLPLDKRKAKLRDALTSSIPMIMVVNLEMDLMELLAQV